MSLNRKTLINILIMKFSNKNKLTTSTQKQHGTNGIVHIGAVFITQ